jgi:antitoxin PrlF
MLSTVTSKGQITIPKSMRDTLRIRAKDKVDFTLEEGRIVLKPVTTLRELRGVVSAAGSGIFPVERAKAKAAVAKRVLEEAR